ncbi:MAG: YCF48-related protein [Ignavibacteria bacterium]|nr:YCF48-related protein [Ignavibacteria bacterium]
MKLTLSTSNWRLAIKNLSILFIAFLLIPFNTLAQEGWFEQSFNPTLHLGPVQFINENTGWMIGNDMNGNGNIYKTTNGGNNWEEQLGDTVAILNSVNFLDENFGCAVGESGTILITTNGGEIWQDKSFDNHPRYTSVQFTDENICFASGVGKVIKTTDGGETWEAKLDTLTGYWCNLFFIDIYTGWVLDGGNATIHKTTNGGDDWMILSQLMGCSLSNTFFISDSIGWYYGDLSCANPGLGIISKTTNGGLDWTTQLGGSPYLGYTIASVFFVNENYGWAAGASFPYWKGRIWSTTNGGENWVVQLTTGHFKPLGSICFVDENNGWVVGGYGTIFHTTNGGVSFVEEEKIDEIPADYNLTNNYPNPFNPSTKIRYSILHTSKVVIKVFDVLGKEIETLVNEEKSVGTYEITWYAENLPSGIYFYQLKAGDFIDTKKMLLLK